MGESLDWLGELVSWSLVPLYGSGVCDCSVDVMHSADYMQGTRMSFRSKEDAIHFAEKQGMFARLLFCCLSDSGFAL